MSQYDEVETRAEIPVAAPSNIVTFRSERAHLGNPAFGAGESAGDANALDARVSFILNVLFDSNRSKVEIRLTRSMFRPSASIVLIPRHRPSLACAVSVDEFFAKKTEILRCEDGWEESLRIRDPDAEEGTRTRIRAHILMDPRLNPAKPRCTEVVFALRNVFSAQRIHSCTIVYDEAPQQNVSSPATLFG